MIFVALPMKLLGVLAQGAFGKSQLWCHCIFPSVSLDPCNSQWNPLVLPIVLEARTLLNHAAPLVEAATREGLADLKHISMLIDTELQALDNQDAAARLGLPQTGAPPVERSVPLPAAPPVPTPAAPPVAAARVAAPVPPAPAPSAPSAAAPSAAAPKAAPAGWRRRWGLKRFVGGFFAWMDSGSNFREFLSGVFLWFRQVTLDLILVVSMLGP